MSAVRELTGMSYASVEITHSVGTSMSEVLRQLADWLEDTGNDYGVITSITTQCDTEEWDLFRTTLVWSEA